MKKKRKICVYAICKNEEKFVNRWMKSMKEADLIIVGDTGSTDKTIPKLKKLGAIVHNVSIDPWRFDMARNAVLDLIPEDVDICVCTDLDEIFDEGWRIKLEKIWDDNITRLRYNYNWSFNEYGKPAVNFYIEKIHSRMNYKWTHPVHEVLTFTGDNEVFKTSDDITVNHYPDATKSRGNYLPLLELSVKENPDDDRNVHYLGREYMYYERWNECIDTLIKHLNLKTATWKDERCASMRFIARSYKQLNRIEESRMWLDKAIKEAPYLRDPYVERAQLEYKLNNWEDVESYSLKALEIVNCSKSYINEPSSWDETIYDILSIACYYQKKYDDALKYVDMAIEINNNDIRLKENRSLFQKKII